MKRRPELFAGRVTCFDRNFPGHELITAILDAGGHVVARASGTLSLPMAEDGGWLGDGSRLSWLNAPSGRKEDRIPVRVTEHNALFPSAGGQEQVSGTCTVITTLLDHGAAPAQAVRDACLTRWSAPETTFGENKTTIAGAGNRTSGPVLRSGSPRLVVQEAWAWLAGTQLTRAAEAAALRGEAAAARALRRKDTAPVAPDEESFTAARRHMTRSMTTSQVTASSSLEALAVAAGSASRAILRTLNVPGRERHAERARKARPKFPPYRRDEADSHRETPCHRLRPRILLARRPAPATGMRKPPRPCRAAARGTARQPRRDTRARIMPEHHFKTDSRIHTER